MNFLSSLTANTPDGLNRGFRPSGPVIQAQNGNLYGVKPRIFTLPPRPSHILRLDGLYEDTPFYAELGQLLESPTTGYLYGAAYLSDDTEVDGIVKKSMGGIFRAEFDGTVPKAVSGSLGNNIHPLGILAIDNNEILYGTDRGADDNGRLFKITPDGEFSILHAFELSPEGRPQLPNGILLSDDGWLYGLVAYRRGIPFDAASPSSEDTPVGALYRIHPNESDSFQILHTFVLSEGEIPWFQLSSAYFAFEEQAPRLNEIGVEHILAHLIEGPDNYLYGGTSVGICRVKGISLSSNQPITRRSPLCGWFYDRDLLSSNPPHYDGGNPHGSLFRIKKDGSEFTLLHTFSEHDGSQPRGPMVIAEDGYLYGTTLSGGAHKSEPLQAGFPAGDSYPKTPDNMTYDGTLYRLKLNEIVVDESGNVINSGFEHLHSFKGGIDPDSDGKVPTGLSLGHDGKLYGTTALGGRGYQINNNIYANSTTGSVFEVDLQSNAPQATVTVTVSPSAITLGATAAIEWSSFQASDCIASGGADNDGWAGERQTQGRLAVSPTNAGIYYYTLTCTDTLRGNPVSHLIPLRVDAEDQIHDGQTQQYGNGAGAISPIWGLFLLCFGFRSRRDASYQPLRHHHTA